MVKTNLERKRQAHMVLFRSDRTLGSEQLVDYYGLRFQREFNFRDAKQYWGREDWMNITPTAVTNAANRSLFMVNVSACLLREARQPQERWSILDLKAYGRGSRYVEEVLKLLPEKPEPVLLGGRVAMEQRVWLNVFV